MDSTEQYNLQVRWRPSLVEFKPVMQAYQPLCLCGSVSLPIAVSASLSLCLSLCLSVSIFRKRLKTILLDRSFIVLGRER